MHRVAPATMMGSQTAGMATFSASGKSSRRSGDNIDMSEVLKQLDADENMVNEDNSAQESILDLSQIEDSPSTYQWQVLQFEALSDDSSHPGVKTITATPELLGLAPRDVSVFAATTGPRKQRATITVRGAELLFRSESCRAIIRRDRAFLFPLRRTEDTVKLARDLKRNIARVPTGKEIPDPFEFRVLESLLASTVAYFESKAVRLHLLTDSVLNDVMDAVGQHNKTRGIPNLMASHVDLKQLLPIQRSLTELTADVKETSEAIQAVSDDDVALAAFCLSDRVVTGTRQHLPSLEGGRSRQTPAMYRAAVLLESYQRQVQSLDGELREVEENIDTAREVWHMSLDNSRNRTLQLNLMISIASFATMMSTVPASFFGMNLHSGLENVPDLLWYAVGGCLTLSSATFLGILASHRLPRKVEDKKVKDFEALRELLQHHLKDMDDMILALRNHRVAVNSEDFKRLLTDVHKRSSSTSSMSANEVELMFKVFDSNRDGMIDWRDAMKSRKDLSLRDSDMPVKFI